MYFVIRSLLKKSFFQHIIAVLQSWGSWVNHFPNTVSNFHLWFYSICELDALATSFCAVFWIIFWRSSLSLRSLGATRILTWCILITMPNSEFYEYFLVDLKDTIYWQGFNGNCNIHPAHLNSKVKVSYFPELTSSFITYVSELLASAMAILPIIINRLLISGSTHLLGLSS